MSAPQTPQADYGRRHLTIPAFLLLVVVYIAIIKLTGLATQDRADVQDGRLLTTGNLLWSLVLPLGLALVFVYGLIAVLGWWRPLVHDPKPVRRWVWAIAVVFAVVIVLGIDYGSLADRGLEFTLTLVLVGLLVGFGEEGMFRCIGVTTFRRNGLTEGKVALWSSVVFGLVHVANAIGGSSSAYFQAVIVAFAGYFFYLIRRVSRSNILNSVLHGGFDFMLLSGTAIIPEGEAIYPLTSLGILAYLVCGVLVLVRRRSIEPTHLTSGRSAR